MNRSLRVIVLLAVAALAGCATLRQTDPPLTADEQLLISTAVDRSSAMLKPEIPPGSRVFLDATNLDADKEIVIYPKYTIASVRDQLLRSGFRLVDDRAQADVILELRSGAQSINEKNFLIGIPNVTVPVPLAGPMTIPEIALYKYHRLRGVSKLALVARSPDGRFLYSTGMQYGESQKKRWVFLLLFSGGTHDLGPYEE